jgi:hypothetical protein
MGRYAAAMYLGIDHLVIAVADPDEAVAAFEEAVGRSPTGGGRHEALGTFNRVVWLGDSYLEFIGIFDPSLAERSWVGRPALRALEAGSGFATWSIATDALDGDVAALRPGGSSLGQPRPGERQRDDGSVVRWRLAAPDPLGPGEPPFLIEHDVTAAEWTPADRAERAAQAERLGGPIGLDALELPVDDPNVASQRLTRTVGLRFRPSLAGGGARDASIAGQIVRLRPRRGGLATAVIRLRAPVAEERAIELFGCRWVVGPRR